MKIEANVSNAIDFMLEIEAYFFKYYMEKFRIKKFKSKKQK